MCKVLGKAMIFDTGDPCEVECWVHDLEPLDSGRRNNTDWANEHFGESYADDDLREMFGLPAEGNFQVLFSGELSGHESFNGESYEWDESFDLDDDVKVVAIPDEYMQFMAEVNKRVIKEQHL